MLENRDPQVSRVTVARALLPSRGPLTPAQLPLHWICAALTQDRECRRGCMRGRTSGTGGEDPSP